MLLFLREGEIEGGATFRHRFHPDASTVTLHNFLADGQTDTRTGIRAAAVQTLKQHENAFRVFRCNTDAIVAHGELPEAVAFGHADVNLRNSVAAEFYRVGD